MNGANPLSPAMEKKCLRCEKTFETNSKIKKYCGRIADESSCSRLNNKFSSKRHLDRFTPQQKKDYRKGNMLFYRFRIRLAEYNVILNKQNGLCAICNQKETSKDKFGTRMLAVDHNHKTGKVRGLLCYRCNTGIGRFNDDIKLLKNSINYLKKYE